MIMVRLAPREFRRVVTDVWLCVDCCDTFELNTHRNYFKVSIYNHSATIQAL